MIGYYVHHQGSGHRHRASSVNRLVGPELAGLSTGPRPSDWIGPWVDLPDDAGTGPEQDVTAHGRLHYVPLGSQGLSARMARIAAWIDTERPEAMVVDVSVEVAVLARLHGVPVVVVAQPGHREDPAHRLAYDVASRIIAPWPQRLGGLWGATPEDLAKTSFVGGISRYAPVGEPELANMPSAGRRVVVVNGTGGRGTSVADVAAARLVSPGWEWIHLDRAHGTWVDDPWPLLCSASVVVSHAGQNLIAEIAAARRPALLLPQDRPFDEQRVMASAIGAAGLPALVEDTWPSPREWPDLLSRLDDLDGSLWSSWNDGAGAARMAELLAELEPVRAVSA
jgi:hypothetical protein